MEKVNFIGQTKGTEIEELIGRGFKGESGAVGIYYGLALVCREKGLYDIAEGLEKIAKDEARHAGMYAALNGMVVDDVIAQLNRFFNVEANELKSVTALAEKAGELGLKEAKEMIAASYFDEENHVKILKELFEKHSK
ncbi:ferritin family protein [Clostridium hydrogenum]|uniref:ferritin family protein n=1 Tax=Clostridium hydrogenum TaxID=2855764 RepID=UPI001F2368DC|nr:ferritin family protein [Clostridium hydrogenum]